MRGYSMSKERKNYPLRLPKDLFDEIKRWSESEMRSVNGQIEFLLRQAVNHRKKGKQANSKTGDFGDDRQNDSASEV